MAFTFSTTTGCNANSYNATYLPIPVDTSNNDRPAHINEMRHALEQFYANNNGVSAITAIDWNVSVTSETGKIRMAHTNELRHAINKMRLLMYRCRCNTDGCCHCHNAGGCWMGGVCQVDRYSTYTAAMTAYPFSNNTGDVSANGTYARKSFGDLISDKDVKQLQYWVNYYNTTDYTWLNGNWNMEF